MRWSDFKSGLLMTSKNISLKSSGFKSRDGISALILGNAEDAIKKSRSTLGKAARFSDAVLYL